MSHSFNPYWTYKLIKPFSTNPKALLAKGEALYTEGEFEMALVQFERGLKFRNDISLKVMIIMSGTLIGNLK